MTEALFILVGLALLAAGGELLVRGGVGLSRTLGLSPLLIGSTIIAIGTSLPELAVSLDAAMTGRSGIAVGNVVGSNISNILLIVGLTALVRPIHFEPRGVFRDAVFGVLVVLLFVAVAGFGRAFEPWQGAAMLAILVGYQTVNYRTERATATASAVLHRREAAVADGPPRRPAANIACLLAGIAILPLAADLLVDNASVLAIRFGVSEAVVGLTVVAVGTSLPELVTSLVAALRRQPDVAIGNILGSNIFNVLGILGAASLLGTMPVPPEIVTLDMWLMLAASAAILPSIYGRGRIGRRLGLTFVGIYVAYLLLLFLFDGSGPAH